MNARSLFLKLMLIGILSAFVVYAFAREDHPAIEGIDGIDRDPPGMPPGLPPEPDPDEEEDDGAPDDSPLPTLAALLAIYSQSEIASGVYLGSEFCLTCHPGFAGWRKTRHAQILRRPLTQLSLRPGKGVVGDYDRNGVDDFRQGLDFNQVNSRFNAYKPNAPKLSVEDGTYFITIGQLKMPVVATQGGTGEWSQRYLVRVPVSGTADGLSAENYVSPLQYNEKRHQWVTYRPERWWNASGPLFGPGTSASALAASGASYSKSCVGCHTTGIRRLRQDANGEWRYTPYPALLFDPSDPGYFDYDHDGNFDLVNVGCEACHGPGSRHVLAGGDPSLIVNPRKLSTAEANEVCGQCHSRVKSVPNGTHDWPYDDGNGRMFIPGQGTPLSAFFTDASARWPDGVNSRLNHQQWLDFLESPKPGFQFHPVKCVECHSPHAPTGNRRQIYTSLVEGGIRIPTQVNNNTLCLACHAGFGPFDALAKQTIADIGEEANRDQVAEVVAAHAFHPYGAERRMGLDRCVECHMPRIATSAIPYDIRSHTFEAIPPEKTLKYFQQGGMPSSCAASCHHQKVNSFGFGLDSNLTDWNQGYDVNTAKQLQKVFGPGGVWWDTSHPASVTGQKLAVSPEPGDIVLPEVELDD